MEIFIKNRLFFC